MKIDPAEVPVFSCIVYLSPASQGGVHARVANLGGLECTAPSEREALTKLVAQFKQTVAELTNNGSAIPWIEPPPPPAPDQQTRFIPVHL